MKIAHLRTYTINSGQMDSWINVFENKFACGAFKTITPSCGPSTATSTNCVHSILFVEPSIHAIRSIEYLKSSAVTSPYPPLHLIPGRNRNRSRVGVSYSITQSIETLRYQALKGLVRANSNKTN